jgi:hypothetical protein
MNHYSTMYLLPRLYHQALPWRFELDGSRDMAYRYRPDSYIAAYSLQGTGKVKSRDTQVSNPNHLSGMSK